MKVCSLCKTQFDRRVDFCFRDGMPLSQLEQKPILSAPVDELPDDPGASDDPSLADEPTTLGENLDDLAGDSSSAEVTPAVDSEQVESLIEQESPESPDEPGPFHLAESENLEQGLDSSFESTLEATPELPIIATSEPSDEEFESLADPPASAAFAELEDPPLRSDEQGFSLTAEYPEPPKYTLKPPPPPPPIPLVSPTDLPELAEVPEASFEVPPVRDPRWQGWKEEPQAFEESESEVVSIRDNDPLSEDFSAEGGDYDRESLAADGGFPSADEDIENAVTISDESPSGSWDPSPEPEPESVKVAVPAHEPSPNEQEPLEQEPDGEPPRLHGTVNIETPTNTRKYAFVVGFLVLIGGAVIGRQLFGPPPVAVETTEVQIQEQPATVASQEQPLPEPKGTDPVQIEEPAVPGTSAGMQELAVARTEPLIDPSTSIPVARDPGAASTSTSSAGAPTGVTGMFSIDSEPSGAELYVDDRRIGRTPLRNHAVKPGQYKVTFKKEGFTSASRFIEVTEGQDLRLPTINLVSLASLDRPTGLVNVYTARSPVGAAKLWIDGNFIGNLPATISVTEGRHHFTVKGNDDTMSSVFREVKFAAPGRPITINLDDGEAPPPEKPETPQP